MELAILIAVLCIALSVAFTVLYGKILKSMSDFDELVGRVLTRLAS